MLASGGLDSSILVADLAQRALVFPLYVHAGLSWEQAEREALGTFLKALHSPNVQPVIALSVPVREIYGEHWSLTGKGVPRAASPDSAVLLPGRNVLLIGPAAVWCSIHGISRIAIGSLGGNPFPDATPDFFDGYGRVLSLGLAHPITIAAPYRGFHKEDLIRRHASLPLQLTLTCMAPLDGVHCGGCNKCHERRSAFAKAEVPDHTSYTEVPE